MMNDGRGASRGFTVVEVLAALAVTALVTAGVQRLLVGTVRGNAQAKDVTAAANLAEDKIEEIRNTPFASLASGSDATPLTGSGAAGGIYTRSWSISNGPVTKTKTVMVTVRWSDGATREVRLQTVVADLNN